jgi:hypothetical protein
MVLMFILMSVGCNYVGPIDPDLVDTLAGSWSGVLDYTASGGAAVPMVLTFTKEGKYELDARLETTEATYEDEFVVQGAHGLIMNFDVAGESWELLLEGQLNDSTLDGNIIRGEAGEDDIVLGTWMAMPAS